MVCVRRILGQHVGARLCRAVPVSCHRNHFVESHDRRSQGVLTVCFGAVWLSYDNSESSGSVCALCQPPNETAISSRPTTGCRTIARPRLAANSRRVVYLGIRDACLVLNPWTVPPVQRSRLCKRVCPPCDPLRPARRLTRVREPTSRRRLSGRHSRNHREWML
jgi:hypothetical protein